MKKYDRLTEYLRHQTGSDFILSFSSIERLIREPLPMGSHSPAWWEPKVGEIDGVQHQAWGKVGFSAHLMLGGRVRFVRKSKLQDAGGREAPQ